MDEERYSHGPETPWKNHTEWGTNYNVTAETSDELGYARGAQVRVEKPNTYYQYKDQSIVQRHDDPIDRDGDIMRYQFGEGPGGQGALFGVRHKHPYVSWMHASDQFGAHVPTLLAIAAHDTKAQYGEPLRSDQSLSERASGMVHRLAQAGVIKAPTNETRNDQQPKGGRIQETRNQILDHIDIPQEQVNAGRQFVRQALRGPKKAVDRVQAQVGAKQQKLFER
jgi:hypothetical protein